MRTKSPISIAVSAVMFIVVAILWMFFAPRPLGGPVSYVVTDGISMQPELHEGDLVIVRETGEYDIGDVVAYESESLGRVVLHRIIDVVDDRYIFQGDNNDFVDQDEPTLGSLLGEEWIVLPGVGKALAWVGEPVNAGILAGAITLLIVGGSFGLAGTATRRTRKNRRQPSTQAPVSWSHVGSISTVAVVAGGVLIICLVAGAFLFGLGTTKEEPRTVSYRSAGRFDYAAEAEPSAVYPNGKLRTGQPIFMNLVDELQVRFDYSFTSEIEHAVSGRIGMAAQVSDSTGWQRSLPLADAVEFDGDTSRVAGVLDLRSLRRLVTRIQSLTGVQQSTYTLALQPQIELSGRLGGETLTETFAPELAFQFDHLKLTVVQPAAPTPGEESADPLRPVQEGTVEIVGSTENTIGLGRVQVPVGTARWIPLAGAVMAAVALALGRFRPQEDDEPSAIRRLYGPWIVDVASISASAERKAVEMRTIHDLAALADRYDRAILHDEQDGIHSYIVEEDGIAYWYQSFPEKVRVARPDNVAVIGQGRTQHVIPANGDVIPGERSR